MTVLDTLVSVRLKTQATADKNAVADSDTLLCLKLRRLRLSFKKREMALKFQCNLSFCLDKIKSEIFFISKADCDIQFPIA